MNWCTAGKSGVCGVIVPAARDPVEVKRFVHLAGHYRKFIEGFGSIMQPLTRLLKKGAGWEWAAEAQEFVFERVKAGLITKPLLVYPKFTLPFRLVTDASKVGLGACLMQDKGRGWQLVAFARKVNSSAESNYSITVGVFDCGLGGQAVSTVSARADFQHCDGPLIPEMADDEA
ncbi:hypothetical protein PI124_g19821 [Phytophthora idaei]|nr:hypothetical protein PI125_g22612 [Phytophthora idaei]KAG3129929.1 hypothetical protein PI126_g20726 [Phytophthora idaei]KAG3235137.1 hypothetical protein PI124_g19821 [Phytophthora idaei]